MNENILMEIEKEYEAIRSKEDERITALQDELDTDAEWIFNRTELKKTEIFIAKAKAYGDDFNELKNKKTALMSVRVGLLKKHNLTEKDLARKYLCLNCKDTGFKDNKPCKCFKAKYEERMLKSIGISEIPLPEKKEDTAEKSAKLKKYYEKMMKYVEVFPNTKTNNFVFRGNTGTGKSFLAGRVAEELRKRGYKVLFISAFSLNNLFLKSHTSLESERYRYIEMLNDCDLLVIDDLGTEPILKNVTIEYLLGVLSDRLNEKKHTIVTTNLNDNELLLRYNERLFSRLYEKRNSAVLLFDGDNFRISSK